MFKEKFLNYITILFSIFALFYAVFMESNIKNKCIATVFILLALMFKIVGIIIEKREIKLTKKKSEELSRKIKNEYSSSKNTTNKHI